MSNRLRAVVSGFLLATYSAMLAAVPTSPDEVRAQIRELKWSRGPAAGSLGNKATVSIPKDGGLLDGSQGSKFLELTGNLPSPGTSILATPDWWAAFDFVDGAMCPTTRKSMQMRCS